MRSFVVEAAKKSVGNLTKADLEGKRVFVGEPSWVETEVGAEGRTAAALGAAAAENSEALGGPAAAACSLVCVGVEGEGVIGALALADRVRPGAAASVRLTFFCVFFFFRTPPEGAGPRGASAFDDMRGTRERRSVALRP